MRHIIFFLFISTTVFAQTPRLKFRQIQKDTTQGSIAISNPADSQLVFSRDFYISYGVDTVLILYGDTLAATSGIISSVLSDGVTITGNGTSGNELKVDTSLIATIKALNDSLATISASTTPDGVTITGDGSVGNPLKVDTATVISTIKGLVDTLTNRGYLTANQTITLSGDVTGSGTTSITATVVDDSHDHIISNVDFLQDSLDAKANDSDLANYVTIAGTETITGAKTFTNTFTQSGGDANFDSGTLFVDESANRVGIGTSTPSVKLQVNGQIIAGDVHPNDYDNITTNPGFHIGVVDHTAGSRAMNLVHYGGTTPPASALLHFRKSRGTSVGDYTKVENGDVLGYLQWLYSNGTGWGNGGTIRTVMDGATGTGDFPTRLEFFTTADGTTTHAVKMVIKNNGNVGIGTSSPSYPLTMGSGAHVTTGGVWTNASDIKLKENINYYYPYGLNEIINLKPTVFDYINGEKNSLGFIAQDVFEVIPEAISSTLDENGNETMGIKMVSITATLVKAIQEQQAIIETQEQKITDLEAIIQALITRIEILENK